MLFFYFWYFWFHVTKIVTYLLWTIISYFNRCKCNLAIFIYECSIWGFFKYLKFLKSIEVSEISATQWVKTICSWALLQCAVDFIHQFNKELNIEWTVSVLSVLCFVSPEHRTMCLKATMWCFVSQWICHLRSFSIFESSPWFSDSSAAKVTNFHIILLNLYIFFK